MLVKVFFSDPSAEEIALSQNISQRVKPEFSEEVLAEGSSFLWPSDKSAFRSHLEAKGLSCEKFQNTNKAALGLVYHFFTRQVFEPFVEHTKKDSSSVRRE